MEFDRFDVNRPKPLAEIDQAVRRQSQGMIYFRVEVKGSFGGRFTQDFLYLLLIDLEILCFPCLPSL